MKRKIPVTNIDFQRLRKKQSETKSKPLTSRRRLSLNDDIQSVSFQSMISKDPSPRTPYNSSNRINSEDSPKLLFKIIHPYHKRYNSFSNSIMEEFSIKMLTKERLKPISIDNIMSKKQPIKKQTTSLIKNFFTRRKLFKETAAKFNKNKSLSIGSNNYKYLDKASLLECKKLDMGASEQPNPKKRELYKQEIGTSTDYITNFKDTEEFGDPIDFAPW